MIEFLNIVLLTIAVGITIPMAMLALECLAAICGRARAAAHDDADPAVAAHPSVAVLIPAHNESVIIADTIRTCRLQLAEQDQLWVVADNCEDDTADVARNHGARVIERNNVEQRGKGYALDFGLQAMAAADAPQIVIILDADCQVQPGAVGTLARMASETDRPVQAAYLITSPANSASPQSLVSHCAVTLKNLIRPLGMRRLGLGTLLTGSGMAFPWHQIAGARLATGHIVEDMQMSIDFLVAGQGPLFCPDAVVLSELPAGRTASTVQRTRWEHGHLQVMFSQTPRLLGAAIRQRRWKLAAAALDLAVPPLSLLAMSWLAGCAATVLAGVLAGLWLPALVLAIGGLTTGLSVGTAWMLYADPPVSWRAIAAVPWYVLGKIPLYLSFMSGRQRVWVRTPRGTAATALKACDASVE